MYALLRRPIPTICVSHLFLLDLSAWLIFGEWRAWNSSFVYYSPLSYHLVHLRPIYLPQNPIPENPQPLFFPYCERPSFTPTQNNRQNYISVYLNLYIFV
jgi:hypothetical protein